jgi:hypothetical protein
MEFLTGPEGLGGHTLAATVEWLAAQGIHTKIESLRLFRMWYSLREKLQEVGAASMEMAKACKEQGWVKTAKEERDVAQIFFNRLALNERDPKLWAMVERLAIARDKAGLDERKFEFEKTRRTEEEKGEVVAGVATSAEEKEQVVKQILGIT